MSVAVVHHVSMTAAASTTVTVPGAGQAGVWGPAGSKIPWNLALANAGPDPSPATAWTAGRYVLLGDGSKAYWNGTAFVVGVAP